MLLRIRRLAACLLVAYWTAIFVGTHLPARQVSLSVNDKVMHLGAFAGLAFLLGWVLAGSRPTWRVLAASWLIAACYAAVDEVSQMWIPGRSCDVQDWLADLAGAGLGLVCYRLLLAAGRSWRRRVGRGASVAPS